MRSQVDNNAAELHMAWRWENLRAAYFQRLGIHRKSEAADATSRANGYARRYNNLPDNGGVEL